MRRAAIDLGTHTGRLIIAEVVQGQIKNTILKETRIVGLGENTAQTGVISDLALSRAIKALREFADLIRKNQATLLRAITTNAVRISKNRHDVLELIKAETGLTVELVSGSEEAELGSLGIQSAFGNADFMSFDIGGGSTEFSFVKSQNEIQVESLPIGAVSLTERYIASDPINEHDYTSLTRGIDGIILPALHDKRGFSKLLIGIAGTITNLAAIKHSMAVYDPQLIHKSCLSYSEINDMLVNFRRLDLAERKQIIGLEPERAPYILAGTVLIKNILRVLQLSEVTVSEAGLLEGLVLSG